MSNIRAFRRKLAQIDRLRFEEKYDEAMQELESLRTRWPGNAKLQVLWAELAQLQSGTAPTLDDIKQSLKDATQLDDASPTANIELGYFFDNVEDDPRAAIKAFGAAAESSRSSLVASLMGQAQAFLQLGKKSRAAECVCQIMQLSNSNAAAANQKNGIKKKHGGDEPILEQASGELRDLFRELRA